MVSQPRHVALSWVVKGKRGGYNGACAMCVMVEFTRALGLCARMETNKQKTTLIIAFLCRCSECFRRGAIERERGMGVSR